MKRTMDMIVSLIGILADGLVIVLGGILLFYSQLHLMNIQIITFSRSC